ncbi:MAG: 1-acyl-sn-glycerol-3-phosphate acyltransferase [Bacteroidales bacterium]|nr:1-acyl-sn-glycerol-3-phosphate acyltransferase [Bacteroidales bacterium]
MKIINVKDFEAVSPFFKTERGHRVAEFIMRICAIDKVNRLYDNSSDYNGAEFAARLLNDLGVNYIIGNAERLKQLNEGAFITVSNHPYGGLDGIILIDLMAGIRPDYKLMVNRLLALVRAMAENFISVVPTTDKKNDVSVININGIRETLTWLKNGHPVGFFPSGAVSDFSLKDLRIRDRNWQRSILHLIHSVKVPVVPIRFFDANSPFFYFLGLINWRIRSLRMPSELFNKRKQKPRIGIGNIISVQEQEQFADPESLGAFLRKAVYEMPLPASFTPRTILTFPEKRP